MPGAGKSTVACSLKEKGFTVISMGDVIREEARQQNLDPTDANLGQLMLKLRKDLGSGAIAYLISNKLRSEELHEAGLSTNIIIDGIRAIAEVDVLKRLGCVRLLAIHASTKRRFTHLKNRARADDPTAIEDFVKRDKRELVVGISEAIALADETLSNNDLTIEELKEEAFKIIKNWLDSGHK
jgi:dephospho-CoA kinase